VNTPSKPSFGPGRRLAAAAAVLCFLLLPAVAADAQYNRATSWAQSSMMTKSGVPSGLSPVDLQKVRIVQKLDAQIPLDLPFRDESGRGVVLADYFKSGKPVVLSLVYFNCPLLCPQVVAAEIKAVKGLSLEPGSDFSLLTVSFNPGDTPQEAASEKGDYVKQYGNPAIGSSWHFLTGTEPAIEQLTGSVGFHYVQDPVSKQYAHPTAIMVLTPQGRVAKYLYGIDYPARDLRLALVDGSAGRIGNPVVNQVLLYCYHYNAQTGRYGVVVMNVLRLAGAATLVALGSLILGLIFWNRRGRRQDAPPGPAHEVRQEP
jgi:protein SCO1/2